MTTPSHALRSWKQIAGRIRRAPRLFLFTDFDGTLAPIRSRPDRVVFPGRVRRLLRDIARSGVTVGILSGRRMADLRKRVGLDDIWYVGVHGYYLRDPAGRSFTLLRPAGRRTIRTLALALARRLRGLPGIRIESKEAAVAVHFRGAPPRSVRAAGLAARASHSQFPSAPLLAGRKIWEWLADSRADKWTGLSFILRREQAGRSRRPWLAVFLGDDETDERVFRKMKGISIAVGGKRPTAARYRLRSPAEVAEFLLLLRQAWQ